ncbi:FAD NAD-binding rossman fold oxidoreductase or glucose-methanol-choline oxidoreductase [Cryptosporidium ubiquitum]|uniref:FAD NAD-binding rossman fold oxidoreductase or glucose-methanol-choline oxidoreductase n=1 Tax=Cryptosporidium ubiquitum TaxID=857276 RepID=A0A1J4MH41_9CRYT|nr:FAD NAD-binding rossman fold oxidoreductase or glucose-methanol-choline oxidoreductase [Cryptosporidium ubiquitum]OII72779.1 FAD NAD-binding rossman fold oxidoreductase or glucose-methanol-choline oxidoreductase [Cryptosporidium ubiquitum]
MVFPDVFLIKRVIWVVIFAVIFKSRNTFSIENYYKNEIPNGMKFDYIIVGASANGLIAVRSLLEKYSRKGEEINILVVDKGKEYKESELTDEKQTKDNINENSKRWSSSYSPIIDKNDINIYTSEDGYKILSSNLEGGKTSYGNTPFIPEDVYSGDYYKSLGLNFDLQRLQESFEYVKSVGDIVQPNVRTSWVVALERAFNETGTFYVGDTNGEDLAPEDSLFENEMTESGYVSSFEIQNSNMGWKIDYEDDYQDHMTNWGNRLEPYNNNGVSEYFTSPHYVPYTFLTYGFRRNLERRSSIRLLKVNPKLVNGKKVFKILNFHVDKVIFSNLNKDNRENDKFAECIQGRKLIEDYNSEEVKKKIYSRIEKYCLKSGKGKIILSAGALNTPMILQRSGVGSMKDIKISSPEIENPIIENEYIGKGLRDHPSLSIFGFFRGLNMDHIRIPSSEALFSKRKFGTKCKKQEEKDDIIQGCESVSISEFEGFTSNMNEIWEEQNIISKECLPLIRGVTIRVPNPYSEGEVIWDDKNKRPKIRLGLLEDINDILILEAGFRRLIRLFRSTNIYSLLIPNIGVQKRLNLFGDHTDRKLQLYFTDFGGTHNYTNNLKAQGPEMIYQRCNLDNLSLQYSNYNQNYGYTSDKEVDLNRSFYNMEIEDEEDEEDEKEEEEEEEEEKVANVRKSLEIFDRKEGNLPNYQMASNTGRFSYLKEIHDRLRIQGEGLQSSYYGIMHKFDKSRKDEEDDEFITKYDKLVSVNSKMDSKYSLFGLRKGETIINERDNKAKNEEPSLWKSLPFILPKLPSYPDQIREYIKKNVKPGNEFVGTTAIGQVVETDCFRLIGAENLYILDEGILSKHTSSSPIGTSMILSRYAITKIMDGMC